MKVLVLGGTGMVGGQVVRALLDRGVQVRVLTRSVEKTSDLPSGVEGVVGQLLDPATIRTAFNGANAVFLLNAVSPVEAHEGLMAVNGAKMAGVKRIVYMSVHNVESLPYLPHFGSKLPVEQAVRNSGIPFTILRPSNFFQNDLFYKSALLENGVYPQPLGDRGVSRVDVRDIAEAAAITLTSDKHAGEIYNLVGPQPLTGAECAAIWASVLGKSVRYGGNDLDTWEKQAATMIPAWMAFDFRMMYAAYQERGARATSTDIRRLHDLLGRQPIPFRRFVEETAHGWK